MSQCVKIALIPAYNPEACLINLVQKLKEKGFWEAGEYGRKLL